MARMAIQPTTDDIVLRTQRLLMRRICIDDAAFMLELLNDADFLEHIGDRGVRTLDQARKYIDNGPVASYAQHGFGLYMVMRDDSGECIGICGLVKRDALVDADIGFAFLPAFRAVGYARESAAAVLGHARVVLGLERVVAIVSPANLASAKLLERIGLRFERMIRLTDDAEQIRLFAWQS